MKQILIVLLNGLTSGAVYFMVASGFSLIFGLLRTVNLAHGSLYLIGAYIGYAVADKSSSWLLGMLAGAVAAAAVGAFMHLVLLRRAEGDNLRQALLTVGFSIIAADLLLLTFGPLTYQFELPQLIEGAASLPLISMASKLAFGKDAFEGIPQLKPYLKMLGERPHFAKVAADRKAAAKRKAR